MLDTLQRQYIGATCPKKRHGAQVKHQYIGAAKCFKTKKMALALIIWCSKYMQNKLDGAAIVCIIVIIYINCTVSAGSGRSPPCVTADAEIIVYYL